MAVEPIRRWWREPDRFDWMTDYLRLKGLLGRAQALMVVIAASSSLVPVMLMFTPEFTGLWRVVGGIGGAVVATAVTLMWIIRWPGRRLSAAAAMGGTAVITVWSLLQSEPFVSLLACGAMSIIGGYAAFFHTVRLVCVNLVCALVVCTAAVNRLAGQVSIEVALSSGWLIMLLNFSFPFAIHGIVRVLSDDVLHSEHDPLTGALNRRGFHRQLLDQVGGAPSDGCADLMVVVIDLDQFKLLNDTHGHLAGDEALMAVARALRDSCGAQALVCRIGGEEFLATVVTGRGQPPLDMAGAICAAIAALPMSVTASVGVTAAPVSQLQGSVAALQVNRLIARADEAMYQAKRAGGNQPCHLAYVAP